MGEWKIESHDCAASTADSYGSNYLNCHVTIERQSTFYVANILVPMALTSMVTLVVFIIPANSGEKTGFLLKIYISTSVYLNFIVDFLPKSMVKVRTV